MKHVDVYQQLQFDMSLLQRGLEAEGWGGEEPYRLYSVRLPLDILVVL